MPVSSDTFSVTRRFTFDAAHRVWGHEGNCRHIHGHRYVAEVTVLAEKLDSLGRVVDFSVIKKKVGDWIAANWDHNLLVNTEDPLFTAWVEDNSTLFQCKKPFSFLNENPTAENIAKVLYRVSDELLNVGEDNMMVVENVRIWETENCYADYSRGS